MTTNRENTVMDKMDEFDNSEKSTVNKSNKWNWLIFLLCALIAFGVWFYTLFLDDLFIYKDYLVKYVLTDADEFDSISPMYGYIRFYGLSSSFKNLQSPIIIEIPKSNFYKEGEYSYNVPMQITINCPEGLHTHDDENLKFTLKNKDDKPSENDTSTDK